MTWGSHCHMCGHESCAWSSGAYCEGKVYTSIVRSRDAHDRLPWWKRLFRRRPPVSTSLAQFEEMRRLSDDFGCGSVLRYGDDRYGASK